MGKTEGEENDGNREEVDQVLPARAAVPKSDFKTLDGRATAVAPNTKKLIKNQTAEKGKVRASPKTMLRKLNRSCLGLSNPKVQVSVHPRRVVETSLCGCPA